MEEGVPRSLLEQILFQRRTESSSLLTRGDSVNTWLNAEMGARKIIASTESKYGIQVAASFSAYMH